MTPEQIKQRLADAGLRVKPLSWFRLSENQGWNTLALGSRFVIKADKGAFYLTNPNGMHRFLTVAAAQKKAQADHERHVYEALQEIGE